MNDTVKSNTASSPATEEKSKREKSTLCKVLPTDRIAFERQVEILRAYAACFEANGGNPVSNQQAGDALTPKFSASTLGVAVPFFTDVGLITRSGQDFIPSSELVAYNQAVSLNTDEAKRKLRPLFENTWFCRTLSPRLRLSPQTTRDAIGVLAIEARASEEHLARVDPLLRFLELAGIVSMAGGTVTFLPPTYDIRVIPPGKTPVHGTPETFTDQEEHSLFLDKEKTRKFTINSPLFITQAEYDRVCKWIKVALIVEGEEQDHK